MGRLENKVAVITGGNSGIGLATAKQFIDEGAKVIVNGRSAKTLEQTKKELGSSVTTVQGDVANFEDLDKLFDTAKELYGRIDVLFLNAGIAEFRSIEQADEAFFDQQFDVNVKGVYFAVQKALPLLSQNASIIVTSSVAGTVGWANFSVYSATKAAVRSLARTLSAELVDRGIRVNVVSPGPIETPIFGRMGLPQETVSQLADHLTHNVVPMKRIGKAHEVANAVTFLASDESSYMAGSEVVVSGGQGNI